MPNLLKFILALLNALKCVTLMSIGSGDLLKKKHEMRIEKSSEFYLL